MRTHAVVQVLTLRLIVLCALIGLPAVLGCDDGRKRELEQQVEEQKREIEKQGKTIGEQDDLIDKLIIAIPTVIFVALFVGTLMGLKGRNDAKKCHLTDMKENEEHDK